jgi:hypothetical protein
MDLPPDQAATGDAPPDQAHEAAPAPLQDEPDRLADKQANVMKDQLRKEVALWNAERNDSSARQVTDLGVPATPRAAPRTTKPKRAKAAATAPATQPATTTKKPFAMSFDGVTDAQHISYMIARGAR